MSLFQELAQRGLIKQTTSPEVEKLLDGNSISFYCGFDPTSDSLHVGSLLPLITMRRLQEFGHKPLALVGGATGFVGDPSFKQSERPPLSEETILKNLQGISKNIHQIIPSAQMVNNFDWISKISLLDFLRLQGKCFSVNTMISRDSVKDRLNDPDKGISFTEFSYQLIQGEDFRHLFVNNHCLLQLGGSDQWSNILSGIDLIRKTTGKEAFGLTIPLLIKSDGTKFGKSEKGNVWLNSEKTSVFDFFQFFIKTDDKDVIDLLKKLTFLSLDEISNLESEMNANPEKRIPQLALAKALTSLVHGKEAMEQAFIQTQKLFGKVDIASAQADLFITSFEATNLTIVDLLMKASITNSKAQGRRDILGGGIKINGVKVSEDRNLTLEEISSGKVLLSRGKGLKKIIEIKD